METKLLGHIRVPDGYQIRFHHKARPGYPQPTFPSSLAVSGEEINYTVLHKNHGWEGYEWLDLEGNVVESPLTWSEQPRLDLIAFLEENLG